MSAPSGQNVMRVDLRENAAPLVSIVVPVYNVENYVEKCVRSLIDQSYKRIEILLINDGSTDDSLEICNLLSAEDSRITVVNKNNGGLSDARNSGLGAAHGEWVCFVDGDDYVSPIFVEALLQAALITRCDIAAVPFGTKFCDGEEACLAQSIEDLPACREESSEKYLESLLYQRWDTGVPWRIYKRSTLGRDPFKLGIYYEDLESVYKIIHTVSSVALLDEKSLYAYRIRGNSIMGSSYSPIKGRSARWVASRLSSDIAVWYPQLANAAVSRCFSLYRIVYAQLLNGISVPQAWESDERAIWAELVDKGRIVVSDPCARHRERIAALIACIGKGPFRLFCILCRMTGLMR